MLIFPLFISSCISSNKGPDLQLSTYNYDFGSIQRDSSYNGSVIIKNIGHSSLTINDIDAGCFCTNAYSSKKQINPGDTSLLTFTYNTMGKFGEQENYIIIYANTDSSIHNLQLRAQIK